MSHNYGSHKVISCERAGQERRTQLIFRSQQILRKAAFEFLAAFVGGCTVLLDDHALLIVAKFIKSWSENLSNKFVVSIKKIFVHMVDSTRARYA
jgi:hypothetical protein